MGDDAPVLSWKTASSRSGCPVADETHARTGLLFHRLLSGLTGKLHRLHNQLVLRVRQVRIRGYYSPDREEVNRSCAATTSVSAFAATDALESTPAGPDWANLRTGRARVWWPVLVGPLASGNASTDWHSLERHEDIRVNLADHAANTTCPLPPAPNFPDAPCVQTALLRSRPCAERLTEPAAGATKHISHRLEQHMIDELIHFYRRGEKPFRSLSALPDGDGAAMMRDLYVPGAVFWGALQGARQYLQARGRLRRWLRCDFVAKGGVPQQPYPIYMVLGMTKWFGCGGG